jgi:hypothetical protein
LPDSGRVEFTDTLRPSARALNAVGDSVAAEIFWTSLDTTLVVVDSTTGTTFAKALGTGRLQARAGNLFSNPQTVSILAKLDSLRAASATRVTVFVTPVPPDTAADSLSDSLTVQAFAHPIAPVNRRVVYAAATYPASGPVITLLPNDSVLTNSAGVAFVRVKMLVGSIPDSVVVTATMRRLDGSVIPDPVTFVVEFRP